MFFSNYHLQQIFVSINAMVGALSIMEPFQVIGLRILLVLVGAAIVVATNLISIYVKPVDRIYHAKERRRIQNAVHHTNYPHHTKKQ
jgi:hypothetical protein